MGRVRNDQDRRGIDSASARWMQALPNMRAIIIVSATPFMPLWVADFVADTLDLDAKELGAYMLMLMSMWGRDGYLPSDEKKLQRVARCGRDWPRVWASIRHYFEVDGDRITQGRLLKEMQKVAAKREVKAQSGALGGRAKALKNKEQALANATETLKQPEPYQEKEKKRVAKATLENPREVAEILEAWASPEAVASFLEYRRKSKAKGLTLTAAKRVAKSLAEIFAAGFDPGDALGMAEERIWVTVKPDWYFREIGGSNGTHGRRQIPQGEKRSDAALANIARIVGLEQTPGDGGL